jgi:tRNA dimethylallyltransferase
MPSQPEPQTQPPRLAWRSGERPRWLGLAGPTASGKSGLALALASTWPIEIVSVDSALVYRGMDIGTAKPTPAERARVPHHVIDLLEPTEAFSAAGFVQAANRSIDEIRARGRVPLLVGGTMLYFKALIEGLDSLPAADAAVRADLAGQAAEQGWPALHAALARVDPHSAQRLSPNDAQRIQRALEVWQVTGQPLSALQRRKTGTAAVARDAAASDTAAGDAGPFRLFALEPPSRAALHGQIAARFDRMLADGLVAEVQRLRERGDLHAGLPSMRCVGYRQVWQALDAGDLGNLRERGIAATRQLAKRQMTWLRGLRPHGVVAGDIGVVSTALQAALREATTPSA